MPSGSKPADSLELEVLGVRSESSEDDGEEFINNSKSVPGKRKRYWHPKGIRTKSKAQSCGSLYGITALAHQNDVQRSEPNVHFHPDKAIASGGTVDLNVCYNKLSNESDMLSNDRPLAIANPDSPCSPTDKRKLMIETSPTQTTPLTILTETGAPSTTTPPQSIVAGKLDASCSCSSSGIHSGTGGGGGTASIGTNQTSSLSAGTTHITTTTTSSSRHRLNDDVVLAESTDSLRDSRTTSQQHDVPPTTTGLRASLLSVLGKLGVWKRTGCRNARNNSSNPTNPLTPHDNSSTLAGDKVPPKLIQRQRRSSYYFSENERRIRANDREFNAQFKYANNYIKTSKYSLLTFLPLNLLEQFQRLANFYFLCLLVLQLIPAISSLTPITTAIPLIGVLALTAVKDAYDDIQRHMSDSQVNNRRSKTFRNGKLVDEKWSGVQVGDVIRMDNNQFVAADILLLSTSEPNGLCFIETAELDGETNLKCKQCLPETAEMGQSDDLLWRFNGEIICERPNNLLNKFEGTLMWNNQRFSLDNEKILLRGCVLRNTQWCYGVVVFAGKDTKLMQNSGKTQFKSTSIDRLLNFIIIGIVFFLLSICAFCTLACAIWEGLVGLHFQVYLPWESIIPAGTIGGATVIGLLVFFSYAIVLNTVVPISLYVSVEVIRFAQSFLINWDEKMYYEKTKTHAKARTTTLNEELGQIQYIFSDKTGTLTQNIMTFNKCSINGRAYGDVIDLRTGEVVEITDAIEPVDFSFNNEYESEFKWYDHSLLDAVKSDQEHAHNFFRLLALCHTVMPEYVNGRLEYQAQSPDESALVSAARNFGFVFKSRTANSITIDVMGHTEEYELLSILDFNNVRKRMSVVLRRNNKILLYCKGADSVIYDRLGSNQYDIKARTQEHLNKFAGEGLRTLVLAERHLDEEFFYNWRAKQQEAALSLDGREDKLGAIYEEIECDMKLVGVTAIEDKLQDGVPQAIANLQTAGIKIWVLTGDKQETAINIGYSCQLLTDDLADVFVVDGGTLEEVEKQLRKFKESIKIVNTFHPPHLGQSTTNVNLNGANNHETTPVMNSTRSQAPPAISVVTFRWDSIKHNRGEPDR